MPAAAEAALAEGQATWPDVRVEAAAFLARLAALLDAAGPATTDVSRLHVTDLYLAHGLLAGDGHAVAHFRESLVPDLSRALTRLGLPPAVCEETLAELTANLLYGRPPERPPEIGSYAGRGSLRSWLRSTAVHAALKLRQRERTMVPLEELAVQLHAKGADPEIAFLRGFYLDEFHAALAQALRSLPRRSRNLLRQHYLDGMTLEAIAKAYRVHRATAARWLADARAQVLASANGDFAAALRLSGSELASVVDFLRRQSSFGAHLADVAGEALGRRSS